MASQAPKQIAARGAGGSYRGRGRGDGQHWRGRGRGGAGRGSWRGSQQRSRGPGGNDSENSRPTHFLSLPLDQHQALRSRVQNFQDGLLASHRSSPIPGFDDRLFQQTQRLHMTLGVMALADGSSTQADRSTNVAGSASGSGAATTPSSEVPLETPSAPKKTVAEALELLNSLRPEITEIINDSGNISVPLTGLNIMNDRPDEAYVLWAGPGTNNDGSSLWKISLLVHNRFKEAGFVVENRPLKLHCTILNSTFRRPRQAFSSAEILRRVAVQPEIAGIQTNGKPSVTPDDAASEADFGTYGVDEIHLWKMGSWDEEKRYVSSGHISLG